MNQRVNQPRNKKVDSQSTLGWQPVSIRHRFTVRLTLLLTLLVVASTIAVSVQLIQTNRQTMEQSTIDNNLQLADRTAAAVQQFVDNIVGTLFLTSQMPGILQMEPWQHSLILGNIISSDRFHMFRGLYTISVEGNEVANTTGISSGLWGEKVWFQRARQGTLYVSPPFVRAEEMFFTVAVPIQSHGDIIGVLGADVSVDDLQKMVEQTKIGEEGIVFVVTNDGQWIAHPNPSKLAEGAFDVQGFFAADQRVGSRTDENGAEVLGVYSPVEGTDWRVIVQQPSSEAYASAVRMTRQLFTLSAVFIFITVAIGLIFTVRAIRPLHDLMAGAMAVSTGNLQYQVSLKSQDEFGRLTIAFNAMISRLGSLLIDLQDQSQTLEERTLELEASQRVTMAASERVAPEELLGLVVDLVRDQFDLYHAQMYIVDEERDAAVLRESTGYAGSQLLQQGHHIPLDRPALVTRAIRQGEPVLVNDVGQAEDWLPNPLLPDTRSELVVPLKVGEHVVGALDVQDRTPGRFSQSSVALFQSMTDQVALLFENSELLQRATHQAESLTVFSTQLRTAADIAERLSTILDPDQVLVELVESMQSRFGLYHAHVYLLDQASQRLLVQAGSGEVGRILCERSHSISLGAEKSLVARAAHEHRTIVVEDTALDSDFMPNPLLPQTRSEISVPLIAGEKVLGVLDMQDDQIGRFGQAERDVFGTLAGQVATALQNADLFAQTQARLQVSQALAGAQTEAEVLDAVIRAADLYPKTRVTVFLIDQQADELTMVAAREAGFDSGIVSAVPIGMRLPISQFPLGEHLSPHEIFVSANMMEDERADPNIKALISKMGYASSALLPITAGNEWLGLLALSAKPEGYFDERKLYLYQALAEQGAVALQAARLRDSLQITRASVEATRDVAFWFDNEARIIDANDAAVKLLGYAREELVGKLAFEFDASHSPESIPEVLKGLQAQGSLMFETTYRTKQEQMVPVEVTLSYLVYGGREIIFAFVRDITERKAAEAELRRLGSAVEQTGDGIAIANLEGHLLYANPAWAQMHGYAVEELEGAHLSMFHTEEQAQQDVIPFNEKVMQEGANTGEVGHVRRDGATFPTLMTTTVLRDEAGNPIGLIGTARDISEQKEIEEAIRESEEKYRGLIETTETGFVILDERGKVVDANPMYVSLTGHQTLEEIVGRGVDEWTAEYEREKNREAVKLCFDQGFIHNLEIDYVDQTGRITPVGIDATVVETDDGVQILSLVRDITERRQAEQTLLERQRVAQNQNQALVELARSEALYQGDLQVALQAITEAAARAVETQRASVWFYTDGGASIRCADLYEVDAQRHSEGVVLEAASYPGYFEALEQGITIAAHDAHSDPRTREFSESYLSPLGINSMLDVPIQAGGRIVGVVCHEHVGPARVWTLEEQSFVTAIASLVSTALEAHERVQAEESLRENQERQRMILETMPTGVLITQPKPDGAVLYANQEFARMIGRSTEDLVGSPVPDLYYDTKDRPKVLQAVQEQGYIQNYPVRAKHADGSMFWVELSIQPMQFGEEPALLVALMDITMRMQAEAERERFTTQLGTAADIATRASAILDPDELLNTIIPLLKERFGLYYAHYYRLDEAAGELILSAGYGEPGRRMLERGHKIPLDREVSLVARAARTQEPVVVHDVTADPGFLPNPLLPATKSEVAVPVISAGQVLGVFDVQHDEPHYFTQGDLDVFNTLAGQIATALQNADLFAQTQARLRVSQALAAAQTEDEVLDAIIEVADFYPEAQVAIFTFDVQAGERNAIVRRIDAFESEMAILLEPGMQFPASAFPLLQLITAKESFASANVLTDERVDPASRQVIQQAGATSLAVLPVTVGGEWLGLVTAASKREGYFDEHKLYLYRALAEQGAQALHTARLYDETQKAAARLQKVNVRQSEFLSSMSHELRTPLNSIIGYTEIMLMGIDGELDSETQQDVQAIYENSQHLLRILNDILDLAKIEAGRLTLSFEEVFVDALIDAARSSATGLLANKPDIELIVDFPEDLPPIQGDQVRLSQILNNLVSNAIKFTDEGHVSLRAFRDDGYVCIEVRDSGIGIALEDLEKIFDKFQQADSAGVRHAKGTGLGLPITRQLAELHGGSILVQSELGVGSTFTLRLPIKRPEQ